MGLFRLVDLTVEILEAMEENVVAKKAAQMIKSILSQAREDATILENWHWFQPVSPDQILQAPIDLTNAQSGNGDATAAPTLAHLDPQLTLLYANLFQEFSLWTDGPDPVW